MHDPYPDQEHRRRSDAGILQLTERDLHVLSWVAEQYTVSFDHLRRLLGIYAKAATKTPGILSVSATREIIERWLQLELIDPPRKIIAEHSPYVWLSRRGFTQLGLPYGYYQPKPSIIRHLYATNAIRLLLERSEVQANWTPQRLLTRESSERPVPDAELRAIGTPLIAIQTIERKFTHNITLAEELATLKALTGRKRGDGPRYSQSWYFLHSEVLPLFQQALAELDQATTERIVLYGLDAQEVPTEQRRAKVVALTDLSHPN